MPNKTNKQTKHPFLYEVKPEQKRLKMAMWGESGAGKTYTALLIANTLRKMMGQGKGRIVLVNSEGSRVSDYADTIVKKIPTIGKFYGYDLPSYSLQSYIKALDDLSLVDDIFCVIVDSFSHAWAGTGGAVEQANEIGMKKYRGNTFSGWGDVTPQYNRLVDKLANYPHNLIGLVRAKNGSKMSKSPDGKTIIEELGSVPVHKDQFVYEFNQTFQIEYDCLTVVRSSIIGNTRYDKGQTFTFEEVETLCKDLAQWMQTGVESKANQFNYILKTSTKKQYLTKVVEEMLAFVDPDKEITWLNIIKAGQKHGYDLKNDFENCDRLELWECLKAENESILTPVEFDDLKSAINEPLEM